MTTEHQASRTLVKSPPELWAECSDAGSLARHIGEFGEIRITRLEPETSVSWEAEHASGTVEIEPSGWGTRVTLTAHAKADGIDEDEVAAAPEVEDPATAGVQEEPVAMSEDAAESAPDPSATQFDPVEEEADAKVEETVAESDPAVAADPVLAGGRWKRLIARSRAWFRSSPTTASKSKEPSPTEAEPSGVDVDAPTGVDVDAPSAVDAGAAELSAPAPEVIEAPESPEPFTPEPPPVLDHSPELDPTPPVDPEAILAAALDSLGQAHHRPFSRA
jgi:hypothetical protein